MRTVENFIDGQYTPAPGDGQFECLSPASEKVVAQISLAGSATVGRAVACARAAFDAGSWPRLGAQERADWLRQIGEAIEENLTVLANLESLDTGIPILFTRHHIRRAARHFQYFAGECERLVGSSYPMDRAYVHCTSREPIGVVAVITPWNAPMSIATANVAAALACGNTCVLKPSELSPLTAAELGRIVQALELPPGVLNIVHGGARPTGEALVHHDGVDAIAFTGNSRSGREILKAAAGRVCRVVAELGGNAATWVFEDCDLDRTVDGTILCAFANNGEACVGGSRIYVQETLVHRFCEQFVTRVKGLRVGDPLNALTEVGPVISGVHRERLRTLLQDGQRCGGELLTGGGELERSGFFFEPAVVFNPSADSLMVTEEVLGPLVSIIPFRSEAQAVAITNGSRHGLGAYLWSSDIRRLSRAAQDMRVGTVWTNSPLVRDPRVPFGGFRDSGLGRVGGIYSINSFTEVKNTCFTVEGLHLPRLGASGSQMH
jgi:acyl-CoA reductase-like NAD-dependent aldehyde dehydrogenase